MFGEMLKMMRKSRNLNQVQLAAQLNVTKQTISNWENNNILPSIDMLVKISHYFPSAPTIFWSWITASIWKSQA